MKILLVSDLIIYSENRIFKWINNTEQWTVNNILSTI